MERLVESLSGGQCIVLIVSPGEQGQEFLHPEVPSRSGSFFAEQHLLVLVGTGVWKQEGPLHTAK